MGILLMFNLHVGIPGVAPDLLHSVVRAGLLKRDGAPAVLSPKVWQEQFRGLVNAKRSKAELDIVAWPKTKATIAALSAHDAIAGSLHALLGGPEDCFLKRKVLPYADARIARVSEVFAAVPLTFHLTIQSQFDYLQTSMNRLPEGKTLAPPGIIPSWSALVQRIRVAAPDREILVWDFERPEKVALAFMIYLLGTNDPALIDALEAYLSKTIQRLSPPSSHSIAGLSHEMIDLLDAQYDLDLQALKQIEGVLLIRPELIPEDFHL